MTTLIIALASIAAGIIAGAATLHWLRDRRARPRQGFAGSRDWNFPGHGLRFIDAHPSDAEHVHATLRGDI